MSPCIAESKVAFEHENIKLITLSDLPTLLDVAVEMGYIKVADKEVVLEWSSDPEEWAKR